MSKSSYSEVYRPADQQQLAFVKAFLDSEQATYYVVNEYASIGGVAAYNENALAIMVPASEARRWAAVLRERFG